MSELIKSNPDNSQNRMDTMVISNQEAKQYFKILFDSEKKGIQFPVSLNDVFQLAYERKDHAVRALKEEFFEGDDFSSKMGKSNGGRRSLEYHLTTKCFEFLIVRKNRNLFNIYSDVLKAMKRLLETSSIDRFLLDLPCQWEKTFPDQFFNNIRKLYGLPQMDHTHSNPTYFGKFILEYIYKPLGKDLPIALKAKRTQLNEDNAEQYLHQFLNSDARQVLMTQIVKVNAVMHLSSNINSFRETWSERFLNENQLELYLR
jgi:hypothetical protein